VVEFYGGNDELSDSIRRRKILISCWRNFLQDVVS